MIRGEVDPVFALWVARFDAKQSTNPNGEAGKLERMILERDRFFTDLRPEVELSPEEMEAFRRTGALPPGVQHSQGAAVSRLGQAASKRMKGVLSFLAKPEVGTITKDQEAALILSILNEAWSDNWGFIPLTDSEIAFAGKKLKPIVLEDMILVAEVEGEPVAFMLALPDINEFLADLDGRLFPFGFAKLLWRLKRMRPSGGRVPRPSTSPGSPPGCSTGSSSSASPRGTWRRAAS